MLLMIMHRSSIWVIKVSSDINSTNWYEHKIICDCPSFQKNFICKHSLGLAVNLKYVKVPENAKYDITQIGQKPKRGRPPKATKALMIQ